MDEQPIGRPAPRDAAFRKRTREVDWDDLLTEMQVDKMSYDQRKRFIEVMVWAIEQIETDRERRERAPVRRYLIMTGLGFAVTLVSAFGAFVGGEIANASKQPSPCPAGYECIAAPAPTPSQQP